MCKEARVEAGVVVEVVEFEHESELVAWVGRHARIDAVVPFTRDRRGAFYRLRPHRLRPLPSLVRQGPRRAQFVQTPVQTSGQAEPDLQAGSNPVCAFLGFPGVILFPAWSSQLWLDHAGSRASLPPPA